MLHTTLCFLNTEATLQASCGDNNVANCPSPPFHLFCPECIYPTTQTNTNQNGRMITKNNNSYLLMLNTVTQYFAPSTNTSFTE